MSRLQLTWLRFPDEGLGQRACGLSLRVGESCVHQHRESLVARLWAWGLGKAGESSQPRPPPVHITRRWAPGAASRTQLGVGCHGLHFPLSWSAMFIGGGTVKCPFPGLWPPSLLPRSQHPVPLVWTDPSQR